MLLPLLYQSLHKVAMLTAQHGQRLRHVFFAQPSLFRYFPAGRPARLEREQILVQHFFVKPQLLGDCQCLLQAHPHFAHCRHLILRLHSFFRPPPLARPSLER
jgi:hypothetical protein